jgi:hypothetical protein
MPTETDDIKLSDDTKPMFCNRKSFISITKTQSRYYSPCSLWLNTENFGGKRSK